MPAEPKKAPVLQFDRDTLAAVLAKIDPTLTTETLSGLIKATGGTEAAAIKVLFGQVNQLILGGSATVEESDLEGIFKSIETASPAGKLISLAGTDSVKLAALAGSDIGARYALIHGIPFAIIGNAALHDNLNRDGSLYKFDPNTGEKRYTDEWLKDRSQFLAVKFNAAGESSLAVAGTQSWTFEERTDAGASRIQVSADQDQRAAAKMIFATGATTTQTVVGSASGDHIYGGAGDDNINAGAGDDYVEGGSGGDMIDGGRGNDTLLGGAGDDQLDGNLGDDKLVGGIGADYLVGGKGNDRLDGGIGFDTYVIDAGDGADTIVDADGQGEIILDGQALTGAATFAEGKYKSADGKLTFAFAGDPEEGGVLVISSDADSVKLANFKNGALGIKLGDGSGAALLAGDTSNQEIVDLWGGNRVIDLPPTPSEIISPLPPGSQSSGRRNPSVTDEGQSAAADSATSVKPNNSNIASIASATVSVALNGDYAELFSDPNASMPLLTGKHVVAALERNPSQDFKAGKRELALSGLFGTSTFLNPTDMYNDFGVHPRQLEYALMDFHNAIAIAGVLGGDYLGDANGISAGTLSMGASFDNQKLADDKYTDLGSRKIGVKA